MPNFSFSTKPTKPSDTNTVEEVKEYCEDHGINFSHLVVKLLKEWHKENVKNGH